MNFCRLLCGLAVGLALAGCTHEKTKEPAKPKSAKPTPSKPTIPDMNGDMGFQSFLGRLRTAVHTRDKAMITSMMAPDFGWRWDAPPAGETAFSFWDEHKLWPELERLMGERFGPHESYMVSPPQFVTDPDYRGFRCGIRQVNGSWRFAYFITGEDVLP